MIEQKDKIIKIPFAESILFLVAGLMGFPFSLMTIIIFFATLGDPLLQKIAWFKRHSDSFPATYKESLFMNGFIFLAFAVGFVIRLVW
jgi:hypothetical protein